MVHWIMSWRGFLDLVWLFFLLFLLRYFWRNRQSLKQSQSWLITKGHITQFAWIEERHRLWPKIEYSYQVFDRDFQSESFFLDSPHNTPNSQYARKLAYRVAVAYEKDETIDVYYNPNNPQQAVLDTSIPRKLDVIIGLLIALILLHFVIVVCRWF